MNIFVKCIFWQILKEIVKIELYIYRNYRKYRKYRNKDEF